MTHRTTFALDEAAAPAQPDPSTMLRALFASGGGLELEKGNAYISEVYEDRKDWRGE